MNNKYKNTVVEFHILQSFPVTCLNRDDIGSPKTAIIGGTPRARVSSQCWKRAIRMQMHSDGTIIGSRTKLITKIISDACLSLGATIEQAQECTLKAATIYTDKIDKEGSSNILIYISNHEALAIAKFFEEVNFDATKRLQKDLIPILRKNISTPLDGLDIALFGRMIAKEPTLNVFAASSFSHAISTHKVVSEIDFFTALDDLSDSQGAGHLGSLEYNSATYYRYISLNLGQLAETLQTNELDEAIDAFVKSIYLAIPNARQTSQSGASFWDYARVYVREGQRLQVPFDKAITQSNNSGYLDPSKKYMCDFLDKKKKLSGSLFGLIKQFDYGDNEDFSFDDLCNGIKQSIKEIDNE